jgi:hypothetical protein
MTTASTARSVALPHAMPGFPGFFNLTHGFSVETATHTFMTPNHDATFRALRQLLLEHAEGLVVAADTTERLCLEAAPGPATLAAWGGKVRRPTIPVAWVERGKSYVGYHLMGLDGHPALAAGLSPGLRARMHGKTCFNFQGPEAALLTELGDVTAASIAGLRRAGFVTIS